MLFGQTHLFLNIDAADESNFKTLNNVRLLSTPVSPYTTELVETCTCDPFLLLIGQVWKHSEIKGCNHLHTQITNHILPCVTAVTVFRPFTHYSECGAAQEVAFTTLDSIDLIFIVCFMC